ncbi:MAG: MBL fold metallo-hydrolase [Lachnospiraceae bacterium]|nr:MBL fold metallo-hydrolase [Lachnospiraceae bacterium]
MRMLHYVVGPIATNCYIPVSDDDLGIVIDPGDSGRKIGQELVKNNVRPQAILLTHGHIDHVSGVGDLKDFFAEKGIDIPVYIMEDELETLRDPEINLSAYMGQKSEDFSGLVTDTLEADEERTIADFTFRTIPTPGHTPGGCSYYFPEQKWLFSGDTLFCASAGRTDFKGSSTSQLVHSLNDRLFKLPDDVVVYPGHDRGTTIGFEKAGNPYSGML